MILNLVTEEENLLLTKEPTSKEAMVAIFWMNEHSAPGPDGFSGSFYRSCWQILEIMSLKPLKKF